MGCRAGGHGGFQKVLALISILLPTSSILNSFGHTPKPSLLPGGPAKHPPQLLLQQGRGKELRSPFLAPCSIREGTKSRRGVTHEAPSAPTNGSQVKSLGMFLQDP